jgi:hypothetical protein
MSGSSEMTAQPTMPDLRIVPIENVVPHEEHDQQRSEPLVARIRSAGTWLNPPIVAPMDNEAGDEEQRRYVVLDGANRHYALSALGYRYILVQVVDYDSPAVFLGTWHHVISGLPWDTCLKQIKALPSVVVELTDVLHARAALARREALAYIVVEDQRAYTITIDDHSIRARTATLRQLVDTYKRSGVLNRINTDVFSTGQKMYPDAVAIVVFPQYQPAEILLAARDGIHLPPGISRHIIQGRAMRLNYPLDAFKDDGESLGAKNLRLTQWIQERLAERRVRHYAESTYLFDE